MIEKIKNILETTKNFLQTPEEREEKQRKIIDNMKKSVEKIILNFCNDTGKTEYFSKASIYKIKEGVNKSGNLKKQVEEKLQELDKRITLNQIGIQFTVFLSENTVNGISYNIIKTFTLVK